MVMFNGERIKKLRSSLGLTMLQFARRVGVSEATVSLWESDQRHPKWAAMVKLNQLEEELGIKATA